MKLTRSRTQLYLKSCYSKYIHTINTIFYTLFARPSSYACLFLSHFATYGLLPTVGESTSADSIANLLNFLNFFTRNYFVVCRIYIKTLLLSFLFFLFNFLDSPLEGKSRVMKIIFQSDMVYFHL